MVTSPVRTLAIIACVALLGTACTSGGATDAGPTEPPTGAASASDAPTPSAEGGSLRYMLRYDPEFIDPGFVVESEGAAVVDALFDGLLEYGPDFEPVPAVAESFEVDETGTVYTFHLDAAATFHDGTPVDAESFLRAWNRVVLGDGDELSPNAHHLAPVAGYEESRRDDVPLTGLEAVDATTLRVTLQYPYADFPAVVAHPALSPVPEAVEDRRAFRESPIGNGPFAMAEPWQRGQFIRLIRNEDYAGQVPRLDEVVFRIYGGDDAEERAYDDFEDGLLHVAAVPREKLDEAAAAYGVSDDGYTGPGLLTGESLFLYYYGFNTERPPFDDPDVRRALSMLIDREAIAEEVMDGTRIPARSLVPSAVPGSEPDTCQYCRFDPEAAQGLLGETVLEDLTISFNDHPVQRAIANRVANDIEEHLGIEVALRSLPFDEYLDAIRGGDIGLFRLGWDAEYPTLDNFIWSLVSSFARGDTNVFRFSDPDQVDDRLQQARAALDPTERRRLYVEAERAALDQVPLAPMLFYRHSRVVAEGVEGLVLRADGSVDLRDVRVTSG